MQGLQQSLPGCHLGWQVHQGQRAGSPLPAVADDAVQPSAVGAGPWA